jgi:hypothetical protein
MNMKKSGALSWLSVGVLSLARGVTSAVAADDPCSAFKWNVTEERAVFSQNPEPTAAGRKADAAPAMTIKKLYNLALSPQSDVKFAVPPGKKGLPDGAYAGLIHFRVPTAGAYRISMDQGFWIDVVSHLALVDSTDFTGAHDCSAPRKIVQYNLPANEDLVLQFSAATKDHVRVAVTPADASSAAAPSGAMAPAQGPAAATGPKH